MLTGTESGSKLVAKAGNLVPLRGTESATCIFKALGEQWYGIIKSEDTVVIIFCLTPMPPELHGKGERKPSVRAASERQYIARSNTIFTVFSAMFNQRWWLVARTPFHRSPSVL